MSSTLKIYKEYLNGGFTSEEAESMVNSMELGLDGIATKNDLKQLEGDLKIFFGYLVGGTVLVAIVLPLVIATVTKLLEL
jgi:hypothetical protein